MIVSLIVAVICCKLVLSCDQDDRVRKIVLDVGNYGIGQRMLAITSAAIFASMSGRTLEARWERTASCRKSFSELFVPKASPYDLKPFEHDHSGYHLNSELSTEKACHIHINEEEEFIHLHLISDQYLYEKLDQECSVIFIKSNNYFAHFLLVEQFGDLSKRYRTAFHRPFNEIAKILFVPDRRSAIFFGKRFFPDNYIFSITA